MLQNSNPIIYETSGRRKRVDENEFDDDISDLIDAEEIFDHIRDILDPEHPLTLEQLNVVSIDKIYCADEKNDVIVHFQPTIPKCSTAALIGLAIVVKLLLCLPSRFKITVLVFPGSHDLEKEINKQLNDTERVCAAMENKELRSSINDLLGVNKE